jgi:hypothetical protein
MKRYLLLAFFIWVLAASSLHAAKPEVSGFYPAGGQVGQTVEVEVLGKLGTLPVHVWCDREGVSAEATKDGKKLELTISPEAEPGLSWLRVWNSEGASALRPFLLGRLPEVLEKEPNETLTNAQEVDASGTVVNGRLQRSGELDTFKVSLKKDQTLVADVLANEVLASPMDAVLQIASPTGFVLAQADDSPKFDPCLAFTASEAGDYFVRVFAFPSEPNSSIRYAGGENYIYRLTLTTGPYVHHAIPLAVSSEDTSALKVKGWNLPEDSPSIDVSQDTDEWISKIPYPAAVPIAVRAADHPSFLESAIEGEKTLSPPFSITGTIAEADEVDRYRIAGKKGTTLKVRVESAALGFPLDPVLEIRDAQGKSLQVVDDKSRGDADADYDWKVPEDGEYQILISDRFQHGGWDYAYLLTVQEPKPATRLSVAADAFTLTQDKPLEIPVSVAKENGFDEKLELEVTGLPEGFAVETAAGESSDSSDSSGGGRRGRSRSQAAESVKVKITANTEEAFHGPVWITAKAGEEILTAATPEALASAKARHVWITYQPKK